MFFLIHLTITVVTSCSLWAHTTVFIIRQSVFVDGFSSWFCLISHIVTLLLIFGWMLNVKKIMLLSLDFTVFLWRTQGSAVAGGSVTCEPWKSVRQLHWPGPRGASTQGHPTSELGPSGDSLRPLSDKRGGSVAAAAREPPGLRNAQRSLQSHARVVSCPSLWSLLVFGRSSGGSWRTFLELLADRTFLELVHTIHSPRLWALTSDFSAGAPLPPSQVEAMPPAGSFQGSPRWFLSYQGPWSCTARCPKVVLYIS